MCARSPHHPASRGGLFPQQQGQGLLSLVSLHSCLAGNKGPGPRHNKGCEKGSILSRTPLTEQHPPPEPKSWDFAWDESGVLTATWCPSLPQLPLAMVCFWEGRDALWMGLPLGTGRGYSSPLGNLPLGGTRGQAQDLQGVWSATPLL